MSFGCETGLDHPYQPVRFPPHRAFHAPLPHTPFPKIPPTTQGSGSGSNEIPEWIKNNAGWWAEGAIDDNSFVQGIQYLIKEGVLKVQS